MRTNDIEIETLSKEEKREYRKQRRIRNQRIAVVGLIVTILVLAGAVWGSVFLINKQTELIKQQQEVEQQLAAMESVNNAEEVMPSDEENTEEVIQEGETSEESTSIPEDSEVAEDVKVLDEVVEAIISEMTLEEKVAGLFVVTPEGITGVETAVQAGDGTKKALEQYPVGGLIYYYKNIQSEEQIKKMVENSVSYCKYPMFIGVDEEGGDVARMPSLWC